MPYCFDRRDKTVADALRRIAETQLNQAFRLAQAAPDPNQLHSLRKCIKKTRGLLQLVRPQFRGFAVENAALRDAARMIAIHRDAEVMRATLESLVLSPAGNSAIRLADHVITAEIAPPDLKLALDEFARTCAAVRGRVARWTLDADGFDALQDGLQQTWSDCRKALKKQRKGCDDASLHRWRRSIKTHWYHAQLLEPIWPEMIAPHIAATGALGEMLGDHHDLAVLRAHLAGAGGKTAKTRTLDRLCAKRQRRAERQIFALAERLFAEPPKSLTARWRHWWQLWRR